MESADSFCCFLCGDEYASGPCGKCHGGMARHIPIHYSDLLGGFPPGPVGVKPANRSVFFSPPMGCFRSPNEAWFAGADEHDAYFDADDAERHASVSATTFSRTPCFGVCPPSRRTAWPRRRTTPCLAPTSRSLANPVM